MIYSAATAQAKITDKFKFVSKQVMRSCHDSVFRTMGTIRLQILPISEIQHTIIGAAIIKELENVNI